MLKSNVFYWKLKLSWPRVTSSSFHLFITIGGKLTREIKKKETCHAPNQNMNVKISDDSLFLYCIENLSIIKIEFMQLFHFSVIFQPVEKAVHTTNYVSFSIPGLLQFWWNVKQVSNEKSTWLMITTIIIILLFADEEQSLDLQSTESDHGVGHTLL